MAVTAGGVVGEYLCELAAGLHRCGSGVNYLLEALPRREHPVDAINRKSPGIKVVANPAATACDELNEKLISVTGTPDRPLQRLKGTPKAFETGNRPATTETTDFMLEC